MSLSAPSVCQNPDTASIWPLLLDNPWFAGLDQADQTALLALGHVRQAPAGSFVFFRGDPPDGLYGVLSGSVLIGSSNALGKAAVLARLEAGQWFGELALFDHDPRSHDAYTDEASVLWHASQHGMLALLAQRPGLWLALGQLLAGKTRKLMAGLHQHTLMSSESRLAQRLLLLADGQPCLRLSQEALASAVGLSRQTCNGMLQQLAESRLIQLSRNSITLLDPAGLARISAL